MRMKGQGATLRHGLNGVECQVEQGLLELTRVGFNQWKVGGDMHFERDGLLAHFMPCQSMQAMEQSLEIDRLDTRLIMANSTRRALQSH